MREFTLDRRDKKKKKSDTPQIAKSTWFRRIVISIFFFLLKVNSVGVINELCYSYLPLGAGIILGLVELFTLV